MSPAAGHQGGGPGRLQLREGVLLVPVAEVADDVRLRLGSPDDHVVLSHPSSRLASTVVDPNAADLVARFHSAREVADVLAEFATEHGLGVAEIESEAGRLLRHLRRRGFLVGPEDPGARALEPALPVGARLGDFEVVRVLRVLEDVESYQLLRPDGVRACLKLAGRDDSSIGQSLDQEARVLRRLAGCPVPGILDDGEHAGRLYLLLQWCPGVDGERVSRDWSGLSAPHRPPALRVCRRVADAYARIHARGWLHADVHPGNLLVGRDGDVRVVDFGVASPAVPAAGAEHRRVGVIHYFEPELAAAMLAGDPHPPPTEAGEQYQVAATLYRIVTGSHHADLGLERRPVLETIVASEARPFDAVGAAPWPALEEVLGRALSKNPARRYPSMAALAEALSGVAASEPAAGRSGAVGGAAPGRQAQRLRDRLVGEVRDAEPRRAAGTFAAPRASLQSGAAGVAYALYRMAHLGDEPALLDLAADWIRVAVELADEPDAFYDGAELTPSTIGACSPFHTVSGVHAVRALVATAVGDVRGREAAVRAFLDDAGSGEPVGIDLTLGSCGPALAAALLLEAGGDDPGDLDDRLRNLGRRTLGELWARLDGLPAIADADIDSLGMAHGWAGLLYTTLRWRQATGDPLPGGVERRLEELDRIGVAAGRGRRWPWRWKRDSEEPDSMPGWCNGSAGQALLFAAAYRETGRRTHRESALDAGWQAWEASAAAGGLCCGHVGRAYAMLRLHRLTGDGDWLRRARRLADDAAGHGAFGEHPDHSLFGGRLGVALLACELERPDRAAFPFCEAENRR